MPNAFGPASMCVGVVVKQAIVAKLQTDYNVDRRGFLCPANCKKGRNRLALSFSSKQIAYEHFAFSIYIFLALYALAFQTKEEKARQASEYRNSRCLCI